MILSLLPRIAPRIARQAGWAALFAASGAAIACSSDNSSPPDAFVQATVSSGGNGAKCPLMGAGLSWLAIGTATGQKPTTVQDGGNNGGGNVSVSCTVHPSGNGFDVDLSVEQAGTAGAALRITSPSGAGAVTTSGATGLSATFSSAMSGGPYGSNKCAITYTYQGQATPDNPPVAAGRIWGHISCPNAVDSNNSVIGPDGGSVNDTCDGEADFLFEQCGQ